MRYIKFRTIVSKTADQEIDDINDIKSILSILANKELDCCLQLVDGPKMELARILELGDQHFKFRAITNTASMIRKIRYEEIKQLEVYDLDLTTISSKPRISRWMILEPVTFMEED